MRSDSATGWFGTVLSTPVGRSGVDPDRTSPRRHVANDSHIEQGKLTPRDKRRSRKLSMQVSRARSAGKNDAQRTNEGNREAGIECNRWGRWPRGGDHGHTEDGQEEGPPTGSWS